MKSLIVLEDLLGLAKTDDDILTMDVLKAREVQRKLEETKDGYVIIAIDASGSMSGHKEGFAKSGAYAFAKDAVKQGYSVGVVFFNSNASLACRPTKELSQIKEAIKSMDTDGGTELDKGLLVASVALPSEGTRAIVVVTDGETQNEELCLKIGEQLKGKKIDIITIGTDDADQYFLSQLASAEHLSKKVSSADMVKAITSAAKLLPLMK